MDNKTLTSRAAGLERDLKSKLTCYVRVGWVKKGDRAHLVVYYDKRAKIHMNKIPTKWYGLGVKHEGVYPPGVQPPSPLWIP